MKWYQRQERGGNNIADQLGMDFHSNHKWQIPMGISTKIQILPKFLLPNKIVSKFTKTLVHCYMNTVKD